jgi:hypothetical protein
MRRVASIALLVVLVSCTSDQLAPKPPGPPRVSTSPSSETVLQRDYAFEPYPGSRWYSPDGAQVSDKSNLINAIVGPEHCDWDSGVMMHVGWPLGHDAQNISEARQYLRDPEGVFPQGSLMTAFEADVKLPKRARYTGYRTDFMELWLDRTDNSAAYLVFADHVERWPRADEVVACA